MENIQAWFFSLLHPSTGNVTNSPISSDLNTYTILIPKVTSSSPSLQQSHSCFAEEHECIVGYSKHNSSKYILRLLLFQNFDLPNQDSDIHMQFVSLRGQITGTQGSSSLHYNAIAHSNPTASGRFLDPIPSTLKGTCYHTHNHCPFFSRFPKVIILVNK